jgi:hypothetical protein
MRWLLLGLQAEELKEAQAAAKEAKKSEKAAEKAAAK